MVKTHFLLENLWISEPSLGILEKFQRSSDLPNIKYNCALLFWSQLYWVFIYDFKIYVSLRLRVQNAVSAQPCVGKMGISLVLLNFLDCNFRLWLETPQAFDSYPCHASKMIRNILNHCLKFPLHCISCHICYGKISEKNFSTVIKDKLLVSKVSNSCFKGLDFFQMLLASHG